MGFEDEFCKTTHVHSNPVVPPNNATLVLSSFGYHAQSFSQPEKLLLLPCSTDELKGFVTLNGKKLLKVEFYLNTDKWRNVFVTLKNEGLVLTSLRETLQSLQKICERLEDLRKSLGQLGIPKLSKVTSAFCA